MPTKLNLMLLNNIKLKQPITRKMSYLLSTYQVANKCLHRLYYVIIVVDFNLMFYRFFITLDVKYPTSARLQSAWILNVSGNVVQVQTSYSHMFQCLSPYKVYSI